MLKQIVKGLPFLKPVFQDRERLRQECEQLRHELDTARRGGSVAPAAPARVLLPITPSLATVQPNEEGLLRDLVIETNAMTGPIIEIGTLLGVTTTKIALWSAPSNRKIITVDNFAWNPWGLSSKEHQDITTQMLTYLIQTNRVELVVMGKNEFYDQYRGEQPSLVFLDAIHDYPETKKDIDWAKRVQARVIAGHDYSDQFPGVIQAVEESGGAKRLQGSVFCVA